MTITTPWDAICSNPSNIKHPQTSPFCVTNMSQNVSTVFNHPAQGILAVLQRSAPSASASACATKELLQELCGLLAMQLGESWDHGAHGAHDSGPFKAIQGHSCWHWKVLTKHFSWVLWCFMMFYVLWCFMFYDVLCVLDGMQGSCLLTLHLWSLKPLVLQIHWNCWNQVWAAQVTGRQTFTL